ncbi:hypothetical protein KQI84_16590 [bacterium]|nr:hypothetical protein [bacterium]
MESNDRQMWLIAYLEDDLEAEQRAQFEAWLEEDPELAAEYREMAMLDAKFSRIGQQAWEDTGLDRIALYTPSQMREMPAAVEPIAPAVVAAKTDDSDLALHREATAQGDYRVLEVAEAPKPRRGVFARLLQTSHGWGLAAAVFVLGGVAAMSWFIGQQGFDRNDAGSSNERVAHVLKSTDPAVPENKVLSAAEPMNVADGRRVQVQTLNDVTAEAVVATADGGTHLQFETKTGAIQQGGRVFYDIPSEGTLSVQVGNRIVKATGAQFEIDGSRVAVRRGTVEITGPAGTTTLEAGQALQMDADSAEIETIEAPDVGIWTGQFVQANPPPLERPSDIQHSQNTASPQSEVDFFGDSESGTSRDQMSIVRRAKARKRALSQADIERMSALLPADTTGWMVIQNSGEFLRFLMREVDLSPQRFDVSVDAGQARIQSRELSKALELVPDQFFSTVLQPFTPRVSGPMVIAMNNRRQSITLVANLMDPKGLMESVASTLGFEVHWYPQYQQDYRLGTTQLIRHQAFGGPRPYFRNLWIAASRDLLLVSNQDENPRRLIGSVAGEGRFLGPTTSAEENFTETEFYKEASAERTTSSEIFYALDLEPGIEALRAHSEVAETAVNELGIAHWKNLFGTARLESSFVEINAEFEPDEEAEVPALNLFCETSSHPFLARVPAESVALATMRFTSLEDVYNTWRDVLRELYFDRDTLALERAEDELTTQLGYDPRSSLLPLLGPHVAVAVLPAEDKTMDWVVLCETDDPSVVEEILRFTVERLNLQTRELWHQGVRFQAVVPDHTNLPTLMWRTTNDSLCLGWGHARSFEQQIDAELGRAETLEQTSAFADWRRETDSEETAAIVYGDFSKLYPKFLETMLSVLEPGRTSSVNASNSRIPMFIALRPNGGRLAMNGVFLMAPDSFLSAAQFWRVPLLVEEELKKRIRLTENNLKTVSDWVIEYYRQRGQLPESLDELRRYGIGYPLNDPFSPGKTEPFRYSKDSDSTWRVWSLGPDGLDNDGVLVYDEDRGLQSAGDIVIRAGLQSAPPRDDIEPRAL